MRMMVAQGWKDRKKSKSLDATGATDAPRYATASVVRQQASQAVCCTALPGITTAFVSEQ